MGNFLIVMNVREHRGCVADGVNYGAAEDSLFDDQESSLQGRRETSGIELSDLPSRISYSYRIISISVILFLFLFIIASHYDYSNSLSNPSAISSSETTLHDSHDSKTTMQKSDGDNIKPFSSLSGSSDSLDIETVIKNSDSLAVRELSIVATNEYGKFSGPYPWLQSIAGSQVIEPYKLTNLTLDGELYKKSKESSGYTFAWYFVGAKSISGGTFIDTWGVWTGDSVQVYYENTGQFKMAVAVFDDQGANLGAFSTLAIVK